MLHGIDKGIEPNVISEKQVIKAIITPQMPILPETKIISHVKSKIGQGRAGIKRKTHMFPLPQPYEKPEQPKLLPERKPIIQIAERPILQHSKNIMQSKNKIKNFTTRRIHLSRIIRTTS